MKIAVLFSCLAITAGAVAGPPCGGVDRSLDAAMRARLAPAIQAHLKAQLDPRVGPDVRVQAEDVLHIFRVKDWTIVHVVNHATDDPYVFYAGNPVQASAYRTVWAGAARHDETQEIEQWARGNAPGIPKKLARCFAWYVTQGIHQATTPAPTP